jgi:sulfite reductase beta subunit-like hemoprotein
LKGKILAPDVDEVIDSLLHHYQDNKMGDESFSEFCERTPKEELLVGLPEAYRA